jgi:acyl-CoA dehydrogenase
MPDALRSELSAPIDLDALLAQVHAVGREVIAPHAASVDRDARFPTESIEALRQLDLLGGYIPRALGGLDLTITDLARICEALGGYCGSTAMIFAMHQIQIACLVHHARGPWYFERLLRELATDQPLIASATTEIGSGGDLRSSVCALETSGHTFTLVKKAPVISYGEAAEYILVTCRRTPAAANNDQVHVLVKRDAATLDPLSTWDTLGFRGTCSSGFTLHATGSVDQIIPTPFADILGETMHPFSHIVWAALWTGMAAGAANKARAFVRAEARKNPNLPPTSALRLAELDSTLQEMRSNVEAAVTAYQAKLDEQDKDAFSDFGFTIRVNNLKLSSSRLVTEIIGRAMLICGISAYRNDSPFSLGRELRDAHGAALMVNNDRIMNHNASLLLAHKEA